MLKAFFDGNIIDDEQPIVSGNNPGLRFGDGIFETILVVNGKPILISEHLLRLQKGMNLLDLHLPVPNLESAILSQISTLVNTNEVKYGRLRLTVFRREQFVNCNSNVNAHLLIQINPLSGATEFNNKGLKLVIYDQVKKQQDALSAIKHNSFLPFSLGMANAVKKEADDSIILNTEGRVCETCIANIWMVKNGVIKTPSLEEGPIAGIMRAFLLRHLKKRKIPVLETAIRLEELKAADEVFISNSIRIINWVGDMDGVPMSHKFSDQLFAELKGEYPEIFS